MYDFGYMQIQIHPRNHKKVFKKVFVFCAFCVGKTKTESVRPDKSQKFTGMQSLSCIWSKSSAEKMIVSGCADLCFGDLAAAPGTSDTNFSGPVNLINTIKRVGGGGWRQWRQGTVFPWEESCSADLLSVSLDQWSYSVISRWPGLSGDSLWEGCKGEPGMTGRPERAVDQGEK